MTELIYYSIKLIVACQMLGVCARHINERFMERRQKSNAIIHGTMCIIPNLSMQWVSIGEDVRCRICGAKFEVRTSNHKYCNTCSCEVLSDSSPI